MANIGRVADDTVAISTGNDAGLAEILSSIEAIQAKLLLRGLTLPVAILEEALEHIRNSS